tara:strand:- start:58 stop:249 length:192 start_codon:yes stop_codon:yes gene_type:complete
LLDQVRGFLVQTGEDWGEFWKKGLGLVGVTVALPFCVQGVKSFAPKEEKAQADYGEISQGAEL